jgi:hypothetical protein
MPSKLEINIPGTPDGEYMTVIANPNDVTLPPVFAESIGYSSGIAETNEIDFDIGTSFIGFLIDNELVHLNGGVISGVSITPDENYIFLDSTANAHHLLAKPKVFINEFEIHVDFATVMVGGNGTLFSGGTQSDDSLVCDVQSNGAIRFFAFAGNSLQTVVTSSISGLNDNDIHTVILKYVGTTASITIDGVPDSSSTWALTGNENIRNFGTRANTTNKFNGVEANVKLIDITTPANTEHYKLNKLTGNYELPTNNVFGSEEITNNVFNDATDWSSPRFSSTISGVGNKLRATATGGGTFGSVTTISSLVVGESYLVSMNASGNNSSAIIRARVSDESALGAGLVVDEQASGAVAIALPFIATATTMYVGTIVTGHDAGDYVEIDAGISVLSVTNYVTYQNIDVGAPIRDKYKVSIDRTEWIGSDLITQSVWENPTSFDSSIYTYEAETNTWLMEGDGSFQSLTFLFTSQQPASMLVKGYTELISGNGWVAFSTGSETFGTGYYEDTGNISNNTSQGFKRSSGVVSARFSKYSLQARMGITLALATVIPVTDGMTLTAAWTIRGESYSQLVDAIAASVRVDATVADTDSGVLMEAGGAGIGLVLYIYGGVLYFQCGSGTPYGTDVDRAETSYTLPVGAYDYVIEWSADTSNAALYVNGVLVDSQTFSESTLSGGDLGTVGRTRSTVAVNRGGWSGDGDANFTGTITRCDVFLGQVTPDV